MKKIFKFFVLVFFFTSLTAFVLFQSKQQNKMLVSNSSYVYQGIDTPEASDLPDLPTREIKSLPSNNQPSDSLVVYRILNEKPATPADEIAQTNQLIEQYLYDYEAYRSYFLMMSSKTYYVPSSSKKENFVVSPKDIEDYRNKIIEAANK